MKSQKQQIPSWLKRGRTLTQAQASSRFGVGRLAARINEIRDDGIPVETIDVRRGKACFAKYQLS
jgi:hypothetical protein